MGDDQRHLFSSSTSLNLQDVLQILRSIQGGYRNLNNLADIIIRVISMLMVGIQYIFNKRIKLKWLTNSKRSLKRYKNSLFRGCFCVINSVHFPIIVRNWRYCCWNRSLHIRSLQPELWNLVLDCILPVRC